MPILSAKKRLQTKLKPKPKEVKEAKPRNIPPKPLTQAEKEQADIDAMTAKFHQAEAEKLEHS
jgi:RNA polymerase II elongation factor ELL